VVAKLLLMVRPDVAVFGQKDAQQVAVVRRLMTDLHLDDIALVVGATVREADGLAMSSRNAYLEPADRAAATALSRALRAAEALAIEGERDCARLEAAARGGHRGRAPLRPRLRHDRRPRHLPAPHHPRGRCPPGHRRPGSVPSG
jgi:pantothenate synthetase